MNNNNEQLTLTTGNENNYNMQQLMNIVGQTALNTKSLSDQMGIVVSSVNEIRDYQINQDKRMDLMEKRQDQYENKSEITRSQEKVLQRMVSTRVHELLGDGVEFQKYHKMFYARLWNDAKKYGGVEQDYKETQKENYQRAIDYIEAWVPKGGSASLKLEADKRAEDRRQAKALGYDA